MSGDLYEQLLAALDELYPDEMIVPTPRPTTPCGSDQA